MILAEQLRRTVSVLRSHKFTLAAFLVPFIVRVVPELLAGPYPIGYDTIAAYVPFMRDWAAGNAGTHFTAEVGGWLLFVLLGITYAATRVDPVTIVKITGPLLYGLLGLSEYVFAGKVLHWDQRKSILLVAIGSIYFVSLRVSWDLFRNTLGLALMLFTLTVGTNLTTKRRLTIFSAMVLLTAVTHLLVATILVGLVVIESLTGRIDVRRALSAIPGAIVCATSLIGFQAQGINALSQGLSGFGSLAILAFSIYAFLPLIPMAFLGRALRSSVVKWWLIVCVFGLLLETTPLAISSQLVSPDRWVLMMFFPLTVLSVEGFYRLGKIAVGTNFGLKVRTIWILVLLVLFAGYATMQAGAAFPYYSFFAPTSMLQSTVPLHDSQAVVNTFGWLSTNIQPRSTILALDPIYGWVREYFTGNATIVGFSPGTSFAAALSQTLKDGSSPIYTVWWANGQGWYSNPTPPLGFVLQHQDGDFGVFLYEPRTSV